MASRMNEKKRKVIESYKEFKIKNPNYHVRCTCGFPLSFIHITPLGEWKCAKCKKVHVYNSLKPQKKVSKAGGSKRRVLPDDKIITHEMFFYELQKYMPDTLTLYQLPSNVAILKYKKLAFCSLLYLTGSRVSEIVGVYNKIDGKRNYLVKPLLRNQITIELDDDGSKSINFSGIKILKTRPETYNDGESEYKKYPEKYLKLLYDYDSRIFQFLESYLDILDKLHPNDFSYPIFPISRFTAHNYIYDVFDKRYYCHWLRHSRFTNITNDMKFSELMITQFAGWKTTQNAIKYVHLTQDTLFDAMKSRFKKIEN
jgi:hypothetical protein